MRTVVSYASALLILLSTIDAFHQIQRFNSVKLKLLSPYTYTTSHSTSHNKLNILHSTTLTSSTNDNDQYLKRMHLNEKFNSYKKSLMKVMLPLTLNLLSLVALYFIGVPVSFAATGRKGRKVALAAGNNCNSISDEVDYI